MLNGLPYTLGAPITDHNEYTLEIIATNFAGKQAYLTVSFRIGAPLPAQPTGLSAVLGRNCVQLSWDESSDAHGYIVYRGSDQSGNDRLCLADHLVGEVSYEDYDVGKGRSIGTGCKPIISMGGQGQSAHRFNRQKSFWVG